jgi:hypothetical protein
MTLASKTTENQSSFDDKHISERTGKKIPLDLDTEEPHNCPVRRSQQQQQPL